MDLVRFAVLDLGAEPKKWKKFGLTTDRIEVTPVESWDSRGSSEILVAARVPDIPPPSRDETDAVLVPSDSRIEAERAIEGAANYISTFSGVARSIFSPRLPVAFHAEDPDELATIQSPKGIAGAEQFTVEDFFRIDLDPELVGSLNDREDGVALLAETLTAGQPSAEFMELVRFFERAFASSSSRLMVFLAKFLEARHPVGYTKSEVKRWIVHMRGRAAHADRSRDSLTESDYRTVVPRMLFAAYEVLLNKTNWHQADAERRELWLPNYAPRWGGGVIAARATAGSYGMTMLDQYGAFRMTKDAPNFTLGEGFWPRTGPSRMTGSRQTLQVIESLALVAT
jgi:hypothetical protein